MGQPSYFKPKKAKVMKNLLNEYSESTNGLPIHKLTVNVYGDVNYTISKREFTFENASYKKEGNVITFFEGDSDFCLSYYDGPTEQPTNKEIVTFPITNGGGCGWTLFKSFGINGIQLENKVGWKPKLSGVQYDWHLTDDLVLYYADDYNQGPMIRKILFIEDSYDFRSMLKNVVGVMYSAAKEEIHELLCFKVLNYKK